MEIKKTYAEIETFINVGRHYLKRTKPDELVNSQTTLDYAIGKMIQKCQSLIKPYLEYSIIFDQREEVIRALNCATFQEGEKKNVQIRDGDKYQYTNEGEAKCIQELQEVANERMVKKEEILKEEIPIPYHFVDVKNYDLQLVYVLAFEGFVIDPDKSSSLFEDPHDNKPTAKKGNGKQKESESSEVLPS